MSKLESEQPTIDPWLDGGSLDDDAPAYAGIAPKFGWDNACDINEGKRICRDNWGACRATKKDSYHIFDVAYRLRQHGISERLAVGLICDVMEPPAPPFHRVQVESIVENAYRVAVNVPGLLSQAG